MYNTECTLVQNNRNTDLYVLFVLALILQHNMSSKDTCTGSIVAWGGVVES